MKMKAQAAMEFLTTYGWVLLIGILVIAAFSYMGVPDFRKVVPDRCVLSNPLPCVDSSFDAGADTITLALRNSDGFAMNITGGAAIPSCASPSVLTVNGATPPVIVSNNEVAKVVISCPGLEPGKFKSDITIEYHSMQTGLTHKVSGLITANI